MKTETAETTPKGAENHAQQEFPISTADDRLSHDETPQLHHSRSKKGPVQPLSSDDDYISAQPRSLISDTQSSIRCKSVIMALSCQKITSKLLHLGLNPDCVRNKDVQELNGVEWRSIKPQERKKLKKRNEKYYFKFHKIEETTQSKEFGKEWNETFKALRKAEWERFKYITKGTDD